MTAQAVVRPRRDRRLRSAKPVVDNNHDEHQNGNAPEQTESAPSVSSPKRVKDILKNPVLLPSEVAALLRLDPGTVRTLARDGDLPSIRIGKHLRFLRKDILEQMHILRGQKRFAEDLRQKRES